MHINRSLAAAAVAVGLVAVDVTTFAAVAAAQGRDGHRSEGVRRSNPAPATRSAPPMPRLMPHVARPQPRVANPPLRHVAPPPIRHAAPLPRPHHPAPPRRSWRPWGYGAAAVGAIVIGSSLVRTRPSDAEACAADFASFDWETGTILNEDGDRELCPYLE